MGFHIVLQKLHRTHPSVFSTYSKAPFDNGLTEHELDHILIGNFSGLPQINEDEVASWKWMTLEEVKEDILVQPELYTAWFKIIFEKYYQTLSL